LAHCLASRSQPVARPLFWAILTLSCVFFAPKTALAQKPTPPQSWPQTVLIENKAGSPSHSAANPALLKAGMPLPDPRQSNYDVLNYGLNLHVNPNYSVLAGEVAIIFMVVGSEPLSEMVLDFRSNMFVTNVTIQHPTISNLTHTHENDLVVIDLGTPILPGDMGVVNVQFWGQPQAEGLFGYQHATSSGGHAVAATVSEPWSARSWWPCKDTPTDKATFVFTLNVPEGMMGVAGGKPISKIGRAHV